MSLGQLDLLTRKPGRPQKFAWIWAVMLAVGMSSV